MNFTHKNVLKKIIEQSKGLYDLINKFPLIEMEDIYTTDRYSLKKCKPCVANCCFFEAPHSTGVKNYLKFFEKTKVPEKLKENKSGEEIKELEKRFLEQTGIDLFDRVHLVLNSNWLRVFEDYETGNKIFMAACIMLSKDLKCIDYERRFNFCRYYPKNGNGKCINNLKILYEFKNKN